MTEENYEPKGLFFVDLATNRAMVYCDLTEPRESLRGWILYKHPDGQWVTLRKATDADMKALGFRET